ncbi:MAG: hypothetical protein JWP85_808 [Rhodoglobus sp.]|nr:hypothetical protein [Rhodoglobus sp.]
MTNTSTPTPKWEIATRERVRVALKKFARPLQDLVARDANEGDTRLLITDLLCEALGYDKYEDLTTEYMVRGEFADYGVRIDKQMAAFIEVKRATTKLGVKHLRQVEMYAVNEGVEWVVLTNGVHWQVYHLTAGLPVTIDLTLDLDLLGPQTVSHKADQLFYLSKESFKRKQIEDVWKQTAATSPKALLSLLLSEPVLDAARRELRRRAGYNLDSADLARLVRSSIVRAEVLESR